MILVMFVVKKRATVYSYDVTESYKYGFEGTEAIVDPVEWINGCVCLPPVGNGEDTAFLKVEVKTSFLGRHIQPRVEIHAGDQADVHFFERGARGTRYINVSSFIGTDATEIVLRGGHVKFDERQVELVRFENRAPDHPTVLVIAPHPDDAEIAAYGFYSDVKDAHIVTITAGDAGPGSYDKLYSDKAEHFLKKGELRTWNSITVPMLCGIPPERSINLGFFDGTLKEMFNDRDRDVCGIFTGTSDINTFRKQNLSSLAAELDGSANWNSLVSNLMDLLKEIKPDVIVAPHPGLDSEETHRFSSIALFGAIKSAEVKEGQLYLYANHYRYNHLIPYGPLGGGASLPPSFLDEIYFSAIHSHALSPDKQRDKIFSLEAMSDLRLHTNRKISSESTVAALKAPLKSALGFDDSYYRRAVRSNELFFVVGVDELYDEEKLALLTGMGGEKNV